MHMQSQVQVKTPLLKAFLAITVLLLLLLMLFAAGVWRYTANILSRETSLVTTVLPDLEVAQRLTAATSLLQAQGLMLRGVDSLASLETQRASLHESIAEAEVILDTEYQSASTFDAQLRGLLEEVKIITGELSDEKTHEIIMDQQIQVRQRALLLQLDKLKNIIQEKVVALTDLLLTSSNVLRVFAEDPESVIGAEYRAAVVDFEMKSLQIQDYLLLNQELVSLQGLIDRVPLLPSLDDISIGEQERDLLLRAMVSRVIYISETDEQDVLVPLTGMRNTLRGGDTLFTDRAELLALAESQAMQSELLAEAMSQVIDVAEKIRADTSATVAETSRGTLSEIVRYRWFLAALLLLAVATIGVTSYWLLYRRTVVPLVAITNQLDKVGTADFVPLKESYFIEEMDELAKAVKDLDSVQRDMREKDVQLERRNQELARANVDLEQFAHVASHDLQEPLRKLQQFSGLLQEEYGEVLDEDGAFYIQAMTRSSERMSLMISDTLQYARSSRADQTIEPVDLQQVVAALRLDLDVLIRESGAEILVEPLPTLDANATGLSQLFRNLLVNSMKYRREEVECRIHIRQRQGSDGAGMVIEFQDNGIGIREEHQQRIFVPFARLVASSVKGTGLGLAICQKVCDAHGWTISVDSEEGVGTCFSIFVPSAEDTSFTA